MFNVYKKKKKKREIDGKINIYSRCIDCVLKKFETIDKGGLSSLLEGLIYL